MNRQTRDDHISKKGLVYQIPGVDAVTIRRDVEYQASDAGVLTMDIYYPPESKSKVRIPTVIFVLGYSDVGAQAIFGCKFKEMESFISWGRLAAAWGLVAITYTTGKDPAADIHALLRYVGQNAASLRIDENRIGLLACSGHVPNALSVLMQEARDQVKCAVLCYGFMLDLEGSTIVAEAARTFRFVNPNTGKSVDDLPHDMPLFIVRAGQDEFPHLNESIDSFLARALTCNLPITFTNHPTAPHAFDVLHDSENSRELIRQILAFLRFHLLGSIGQRRQLPRFMRAIDPL